jgi:hypothetical protein
VHPLERAAVAAALRGQPVDAFADASDALKLAGSDGYASAAAPVAGGLCVPAAAQTG